MHISARRWDMLHMWYMHNKPNEDLHLVTCVSLRKWKKLSSPTANWLLSTIPPGEMLWMFFSMNHTLITVLFLDKTFPFYKYTVRCSPCCQPNNWNSTEVQLAGAFLAPSALSAYTGSNASEINTLSVFLDCILKCNVAPRKQERCTNTTCFLCAQSASPWSAEQLWRTSC